MPYPDSPAAHDLSADAVGRRAEDTSPLILTELNPQQVLDGAQQVDQSVDLLTFGTVREVCPKCRQSGMKLVLRQASVRVAHLFCADCAACYDAQYANGAPALTI